MATTALWSIKSRLDHVIEYASNPDKTSKEEYQQYQYNGLGSVIEYTTRDSKTAMQVYVTGINCHPTTAVMEMNATKRMFMKEDGRVAYHGYQSFAPGEVTAELAHQIGVDLATKLWGDRYEVVVSTHLDKEHYHNHFVFNSVSFVDGKKFDNTIADYQKLRNTSDDFCRKYRLSVIEEPQFHSMSHQEYMANKYNHEYSRYIKRLDVDWAINRADTMDEFLNNLHSMGYVVDLSRKHARFKKAEEPKFTRFHSLSKDNRYEIENIAKRIDELAEVRRESRNTPVQKAWHYHGDVTKSRKLTGFKALYVRYMFLLGIIPKDRPNNHQVRVELRREIKYINDITKQASFIAKYNINNVDELHEHKKVLVQVHEQLVKERRRLYNRKTRSHDSDKKDVYESQITALSERIKNQSELIKMCNDIEYRSTKMKEYLDLIRENDKEKSNINSRKKNKKER